MIDLANSIARYLDTTAAIDLSTLAAFHQNETCAPDSAWSASSAPTDLRLIGDQKTDQAFSTSNGDSPCYIAVTWTAKRQIDHVRLYWPLDVGVIVNLETKIGSPAAWTKVPASPAAAQFTLVKGWNEISPPIGLADTFGVRVKYDATQGGTAHLSCSELEMYQDLREMARPADWAPGGVHVLHPDIRLDEIAQGFITVMLLDKELSPGGGGLGDVRDDSSVVIGFHAGTEDELRRMVAWATTALSLALSPDDSGVLYPGVPILGLDVPMESEDTGVWWSSGQYRWKATPVPVVRVNGVLVTPAEIDYVRGRVRLSGASAADSVRADFACGIWGFGLFSCVPTGPDSPEKVSRRHNSYLLLKSDIHFRNLRESVG